jgi:hypothetical protein
MPPPAVGFDWIICCSSNCGVTPLGKLMLTQLEDRYPSWSPTQEAPNGIIILGGGINPDISAARGVAVSDIGIDRVVAAAKLARRYPHARNYLHRW